MLIISQSLGIKSKMSFTQLNSGWWQAFWRKVKRKWSCSVMSDSVTPWTIWILLPHEPVFSVHGIFQARVLEWGAIAFSRGSSRPRDQTRISYIAGRRFTLWATREVLLWDTLFPSASRSCQHSMGGGIFFFFFKKLIRFLLKDNCFTDFCCFLSWISHRYTYIRSLLELPPITLPISPL